MNIPNPIELINRLKSEDGWFSKANQSNLRIVSGMVLFGYVTIHFMNHSLGLISREAMSAVGGWVHWFIAFWPISIILYGAIAVHVGLAILRIFQRKTLRFPAKEWVQLLLGFALPIFIIGHVMNTRYANAVYDVNASYDYILLSTFYFSPFSAYMDTAGLLAAWLHGCLGLHMWFQAQPMYRVKKKVRLALATVLVPVLALTGFLSGGRSILPLAEDGEFMGPYYEALNVADDAIWDMLGSDTQYARLILFSVIGLAIIARIAMVVFSPKTDKVTIDYIDGPKVTQSCGATLLEISKLSDVPHASVCGGKGRCSTCRVRIFGDITSLEAPSEAECKVLTRIKAGDDIRLACQLVPSTDLKVMRLLPSDGAPPKLADLAPAASGREKVVTIMFADIRDFTRISESRLPFDVVYLINQFSKVMGDVVKQNKGTVDKFLGDGFMALFGVDGSPEKGALNAIKAADIMTTELQKLNEKLAIDLDEPLLMGIGIHTGSVILGNMGYGASRGLTAIGDTVNTASRLETETKIQKARICISDDSVKIAGLVGNADDRVRVSIRGKKIELDVYALDNTNELMAAGKTLEKAGEI